MKPLPLLLLFPLFTTAQEVKPILSQDYLNLIRKDTIPNMIILDTTNSMRLAPFRSYLYNRGQSIQKISIKKGVLNFHPLKHKSIQLSGQFNSIVEVKSINRLPDVQDEYVQGRAQGGQLIWRGAETGELFSYGPPINSLDFDGSNYAYDINGRLVSSGTGNKPANSYSNKIFRTGFHHSHSLLFQARYIIDGLQAFKTTLKLGKANENLFIENNKNQSDNFSISVDALIKWLTITSNYASINDRFSNSNRNGFLNRVYQNALLTPVSFDNEQGSQIGNSQRSYSNLADNPFFLLDNQNSFNQSHKIGGIGLEKRSHLFKFRLMQSFESLDQKTNEIYKPGTAFFSNGASVLRNQSDRNLSFTGNMSYDIEYIGDYLSAVVSANYNQSNLQSNIFYTPVNNYNYQRTAHDLSLQYLTKFDEGNVDGSLTLVNKIYVSNTANEKAFFLPSINAYLRVAELFGDSYLQARFYSSFNNFVSEPAINKSFAENNLSQYHTSQSFQYLPQMEVSTYNDLYLIRQKEWTNGIELRYKNRLFLQGEYFIRNTKNDVFPVFENGELVLKNIADHRNKGMELDLSWHFSAKNVSAVNKLSFYSNRIRVVNVNTDYDHLPVSGFGNVHKAIIKGQVPGALVGNRFLRDAENNLLIGADGFPQVNSTLDVIGNPNPDFVLKLMQTLNWKKFNLNLDWEWKKGGEMWNGTQAVLDYYGRSESSAQLRNTDGYIFQGVLQNGRPNDIAVKFYDPSLPVDRNRWTRYGQSGVAEEYIQKADFIRINNLGLSYAFGTKKYLRNLILSIYAENILIWTAYKGGDPDQLLFDYTGSSGLDYFNLPSTKSFGFNVSVQF